MIFYQPAKNNFSNKEIKCNLSISEMMKFINYSKDNHIIEKLSEEISIFH